MIASFSFIKIDDYEKLLNLLWRSPVLLGAVIVPTGAVYSTRLISTQLH